MILNQRIAASHGLALSDLHHGSTPDIAFCHNSLASFPRYLIMEIIEHGFSMFAGGSNHAKTQATIYTQC